MKRLTLIAGTLCLLFVAWLAYGFIHERRLLASGDPLLMVNKSKKSFAYSDQVSPSELAGFKPVARLSDLTEDQLIKKTRNLTYYFVTRPAISSENRLSALELSDLSDIFRGLTKDQQGVCSEILDTQLSQDCIAWHEIFNDATDEKTSSVCAKLPEKYQQACTAVLEAKQVGFLTDKDGNKLLDKYEFFAHPETFDPDPLK